MNLKVLDKGAITPLVEALMDDYRVVGPHAKGSKFTFEAVTDPANLRLDYDTTILPPKKVFLTVCAADSNGGHKLNILIVIYVGLLSTLMTLTRITVLLVNIFGRDLMVVIA